MSVKARPAVYEAVRQRWNRWSSHPAAGQAMRLALCAGAGLALAGSRAGEILLPLPLALAGALGLGLNSFAAYAGGCLGYALFWGMDAGLHPMAAGLLMEACLCIFGGEISGENRWFGPAMAALFTVLVGLLFLLERRFAPAAVWSLLVMALVAGGGTAVFTRALAGARLPRLALLAALVNGLSAVAPWGLPLGAAAGFALSAAALDGASSLTVSALGGAALELGGYAGCGAVLPLAALLATAASRPLGRRGLWLGGVTAAVLLTGAGPVVLTAALVGFAAAWLLPARRLFGDAAAGPDSQSAAAQLLEGLGKCLALGRPSQSDPEAAAVFDRAADQVCRLCSRFDLCWQKNLGETCAALDRATPAMMARGKALPADLPAAFTEGCCHLEGFLTAINRCLDDLAFRRQARSRLRESRLALGRQYILLSQALRRRRDDHEPVRFVPELACRGRSRGDAPLSGDETASFRLGRHYYVLLCDGMGAGRAARAEAGAAIEILRQLLLTGARPGEAMEFLNDLYLLRDDGAFSTVDLVEADLVSGEATLYKWGAAPSYLKRKGQMEKIGTASPPPGLGVGEEHRPEEAKLSLARGEMLVLVSDGAGGEVAERFIRQYGGLSPKELASGIISCSQAPGEDDRTAAVLTLRRGLTL